MNLFYTGRMSFCFKKFGKSIIHYPLRNIVGAKYIAIGNNVFIGKNVTITAWDAYLGFCFSPQIIIGNGSSIGDDAHITAINCIIIGNNVRSGKKILITDNSHGQINRDLMDISPIKRPLFSKGPVIIEDNVWIGEKVSIMPNVKIGKGSVIAANSVVTKDIPSYSVAAGVPAKVVKQFNSKL